MNVEELLIAKDIEYIPKGGDYEVRCLNPEHEDRHPSMRIDKVTGIFNCFACNYKGNIFTLFEERVNKLQMRRDLFKRKIAKKIAESIGLSFPQNRVPYTGDWRGINPETYIHFEAFQDHATEYVGRIMFPIRNLAGRIVAFIGRHTTGGTPKYLISPTGARLPLYPAAQPKQGAIILVEGIFDVINLYDKGLHNAVCCFGTQNINEDKLSMLMMQGVESIDIFFDGDEAGQLAADKVKTMCDNIGMPYRNVHLKGKDPGELTQESVDKLRRKLEK